MADPPLRPLHPEKLDEMLRQGRNVAIHCRQGIGRSGMIAAALLVKKGTAVDSALKLISQIRGLPVPETPEQRDWVRDFSKRSLASTAQLTWTSAK